MTTKKTTKGSSRAADETTPKSMPAEGKDPKGGLTATGREYFNKKEGAHLRPGVQGPADTPEKMVRKGSFLRRHFANPRGPMKDDKGEPTRLALSAHAWGEPVPQTMGDARKLADEGHELLEHYHEIKGDKPRPAARAKGTAVKKTAGKKAAAKKTAAKTSPAKKAPSTKAAARQAPAKTSAGKKSPAKRVAPGNKASKRVSKKAAAKRAQ